MSKTLYVTLGLLIGLAFGGGAVLAWGGSNPIINIDSQPDNSVSVFDDGPYKCYVVKGRVTESRAWPGFGHAISCLDTRIGAK